MPFKVSVILAINGCVNVRYFPFGGSLVALKEAIKELRAMTTAAFGLAAALTVSLAGACMADDLVVIEQFKETTVGFELKGSYDNVTLTIAGPNGFSARAFSKSGAPSVDLRRVGSFEDGTYSYQLTGASQDKIKRVTDLDNGRAGRTAGEERKGVTASGTFNVRGGVIVKRTATAAPSRRDQK